MYAERTFDSILLRMLEIAPYPEDTPGERRQRILLLMMLHIPYTVRALRW